MRNKNFELEDQTQDYEWELRKIEEVLATDEETGHLGLRYRTHLQDKKIFLSKLIEVNKEILKSRLGQSRYDVCESKASQEDPSANLAGKILDLKKEREEIDRVMNGVTHIHVIYLNRSELVLLQEQAKIVDMYIDILAARLRLTRKTHEQSNQVP